MRNASIAIALAIGFLSSVAQADFLALEGSGLLAPETILNGAPLISATTFTYRAVFDSDADINPADGSGLFATTVTFSIDGLGAFTSSGFADVFVAIDLIEPISGIYSVGLVNLADTLGFVTFFGLASPAVDPDMPSPAGFANRLQDNAGTPFPILLRPPGSSLVIAGFTGGATARITAVPEPASLAMLGGGMAILGFVRRRR